MIAVVVLVFSACLVWFTIVSVVGWQHSISERHGFRQSQTALTAYYLLKGGPVLRYETPVLGAPWSVPLEFPLYQWLTAITVRLTGMGLTAAGRLVSELFFVLALGACFSLLGRFGIRPVHRLVGLSLILVSPEYVFYSRTVMIESTALFFSIAYLDLSLRYCQMRRGLWAVLGCLAGSLAGLVKPTTFLPFALLGTAAVGWFVWDARRRSGEKFRRVGNGTIVFCALMLLAVPLLVTLGWSWFTDAVRELNLAARHVASSQWIFGTLGDRVAPETWGVLVKRTMSDVLGGWIGLPLAGLLVWLTGRRRALYGLSLAGFLLGFLIFTRLHVVHDYYAYANAVFLVIAVTSGVVALLEKERWAEKVVGAGLLVALVVMSVSAYYERFYPSQSGNATAMPSLAHEVARVTPIDMVVVGFGLDWSSELPFYSERRALMWPQWMNHKPDGQELRQAIDKIGTSRIGAMVFCSYRPGHDTPGTSPQFKPADDTDAWLRETARMLEVADDPVYSDVNCKILRRGNASAR